MKLRTSLAAAGTAAVLGTMAFLAPAVASAHSTATTLKFTSVQKATISFTKEPLPSANQDTDVNAAGKTVGYDMYYLAPLPPSNAAGNMTVVTNGGFLYATFVAHFKTGAVTNGKVTGGTGTFAGATGTFAAKLLNKARTKYAVTITYTT